MKTLRNNLLNPRKNLWNGECLQWKPIRNIIEEDVKRELRFFPKLQWKHANPSTWEKMNVSMAAETLSRTVGLELKRRGNSSLGEFILLANKWFDLMNTSLPHAKRRANDDLLPYKLNDAHTQSRLTWLQNSFLGYLKDWRANVMCRELPSGSTNRNLMLLSQSTEKGLIMTTLSMIHLINDCLAAGADYVATRRLNQDPLESHFGHQRQRGRYCDAPTALNFAYNVRSINTFRSSVAGSNVQSDTEQ